MICVNFMTGTPKYSTESGFMGKSGIETVTPGLQDIGLSLHHSSINLENFFVAFLGINQFPRVALRFVCWFYDGNTQRLTESGFMRSWEWNLQPLVYKT